MKLVQHPTKLARRTNVDPGTYLAIASAVPKTNQEGRSYFGEPVVPKEGRCIQIDFVGPDNKTASYHSSIDDFVTWPDGARMWLEAAEALFAEECGAPFGDQVAAIQAIWAPKLKD